MKIQDMKVGQIVYLNKELEMDSTAPVQIVTVGIVGIVAYLNPTFFYIDWLHKTNDFTGVQCSHDDSECFELLEDETSKAIIELGI